MPKWIGTTGYRRGEDRTEPREWTVELGKTRHLRVVVHRHIHYPPDTWLLSVNGVVFDNRELVAKDAEQAKREALDIVKNWCREVLAAIG